jgi:hypothetical protein
LFQTTTALLVYSTSLMADVSPLLCPPEELRVPLLMTPDDEEDDDTEGGKLHP